MSDFNAAITKAVDRCKTFSDIEKLFAALFPMPNRMRHKPFDSLNKMQQEAILAEVARQKAVVVPTRDSQGRLLSPNGKVSKLNEEQYRTVRTPWFKEWAGDWEVNHRLERESIEFGSQVEEFKNKTGNVGKLIDLGSTPDVFLKLGAKQLPMTVTRKTLAKVWDQGGKIYSEFPDSGKHSLTIEQIKQLPKLLSEPVMVLDSHHGNGSLVVVVELQDDKKRPVMVAVYLDKTNARHQVNTIASLHGREEKWFVEQSEAGRLRYLDKKKSLNLIQSATLQLRLEESVKALPSNRLLFDTNIVKPSLCTKVVDPETGEPIPIYHGTKADFVEYDFSRAGESTKHPTAQLGMFLSSDPAVPDLFIKAAPGSEAENRAIMAQSRIVRKMVQAAGYNSVFEMQPHSPEREAIHAAGSAAYKDHNLADGANTIPLFANIKNPLVLTWDEWFKAADWMSGTSVEGMQEIRDKIQSGKHDGILLKARPDAGTQDIKSEYEGDTWIVFSGPQVKSTIGNIGTFSAEKGSVMESATDDDGIILYDYDNKDYKAQIAGAKSFQDIVNVFEVCFPGTADKYQSFAEFTDKVKVTVATIQDPSANPEEQYDAIKQWDNYRSVALLDTLKTFDGFDYMDFVAQKETLRSNLPGKMLDSYILAAGMMDHAVGKVAVKQEQYAELVAEMNRKQSEIIEKYEPGRQAAEKEWYGIMEEYNAWQKSMGYGKYTESMEFKHGNQFPPEKISEFQSRYRQQEGKFSKRMAAMRESQQPYIARRNEEFEQQAGDIQKRLAELKQELSAAQVQAYDAVIDSILAASPVSEQQAAEWSKGNVIYDKSAMAKAAKSGYGKKDIERDTLLFYRLTGGRLPRLEFTTTRKARSAAAHWSGELFIGHNFGRRTLWHEMAHLLEDDPKIKAAAIAFRDRRRDDAQLHRLNDLVPGSNYDSNEVAYKDSWFDPYIGKDYGQTATEVVSMGMQQLSSIPAMFELHVKDPEHLAFMIGLCMTKPVIDAEAVAKKQATTRGKVVKASTQEQFLKDLDKQIVKAGDFWSADGYSVEEASSYNYKSGKHVARADIKYNHKYDDEGKLKSYNNYTLKSVKAAKRALFLWYRAGKPVSNGRLSEMRTLGNIVYQLEKSSKELPDYILQTPLSGA